MFSSKNRAKTAKRYFILLLALPLLAAGFALIPAKPLNADKYSPPDESIPERPASDDTRARQEREKAIADERRRKAEETARQKREKTLREERIAAEKSAEEARRAEELEKIKASSEDAKNRTIAMGRSLVENGRFQSAINTFQGFLGENPRSADGWYWISRAHHALGEYDRAQAALNIAIEIDPLYPLLAVTPSGLEPRPPLSKQQKKEPRPSMSILPVKPPLPANVPIYSTTVSFPVLTEEETSPDENPGTKTYLKYAPYNPTPGGAASAWIQDKRFNEISRWRFRVDRMGILKEPRTAVAWKGTRPYEVYFWTGEEWARARKRANAENRRARYDDILYGAREDIAKVLSGTNFEWDEADTPSLAAAASLMRYMWAGELDLTDASQRGTASDDAAPRKNTGMENH